ncbi:ankyrin repeat domain-containing protein [Streptacidiphilus sp. N1-10]|uniref:Ankyrin repeat domain-containing protein n=1 Tax=Streptacidiphilus jeojiensis TaxID=3229225 RepID=A0ABV6XF28_9ACTN
MPTDPSPADPAPAAGRFPGRRVLPEDADLDHLRGQCRTLQRAVRGGDPDAARRVAVHGFAADQGFLLSSAQLVVAREYGFAGWPRLKHHLQTIARYRWDPSEHDAVGQDAESPADRFCRLACLGYTPADGPDRWSRAADLLALHPDLVDLSIWAAGAAADLAALRRHLAADPAGPRAAATRRGGPYRWTPLFYLVYSRLGVAARGGAGSAGTHGTVAGGAPVAARLLLDAGADPHEGYLWHGLPTPFTLLTGAFGEGEQGPLRQPRHPGSLALARQFLEAGADPSDGQALYNRMFGTDDDHLRLLFDHGLGQGDGGPWRARLGEALDTPQQLLRGQLGWAVDHRQSDRVRLLVEHGVDVRAPFADGRTPAARALRNGDQELVDYLVAHGAEPLPADPVDALLGAALAGDEPAVARLLAAHPGVAAEARAARPSAMVWAAANGRPGALRLLAGLGFDVNALGRGDIPSDQPWETALHQASAADDVPAIRLLLELGADPAIRDRRFDATPLDWAHHLGRPEAARELAD